MRSTTPKFYGRRKGRGFTAGRQQAYDAVLPQVQISLSADDSLLSPQNLFEDNIKDVWLEIGFGDGEHLLWQAMQNSHIGMIGCEPFVNGVANLCRSIQENDVKNIRIFPDDARLLLTHLPDASIHRLFLLNADPWPKTKHHKRRFIQTDILDEMARLLVLGAELRITTDHPGLAAWSLEKTYFHPDFEWTAMSADDWRTRPEDMPETKYQKKKLAGMEPVFLSFKRK